MIRRALTRLWPRSLQGQLLLAVAVALLLAQAIGAVLLYQARDARREAAVLHTAAFRLFAAQVPEQPRRIERARRGGRGPDIELLRQSRGFLNETTQQSPLRDGEARLPEYEQDLRLLLTGQGLMVEDVVVLRRAVLADALAVQRLDRRARLQGVRQVQPRDLLVAGVKLRGSPDWTITRVLIPRADARPLVGLIAQTLLTYAALVAVIAFILRRITRPLAALTRRMDAFAESRDPADQLVPEGPDDVRHLITAHNALEHRVANLLNEKDVMLGAIGHDLKTPLAALRVRIETVADDAERARMAATIEDITRTLDDILSLARVGRPSDPREAVELSALVAQVCEEYEDMGESVTFPGAERAVATLRATWVRRALRNLISNALRYGGTARVSVAREAGLIAILVEDDGPGIPAEDQQRMLEPFTRGDPSRNSATGGAGLGLTLARAIAEQHGGSLTLTNRPGPDGTVSGLTAALRLPLG